MDTPNLIANIITAGATSIATGATVFGVMWKVQKDREKKAEIQRTKDNQALKSEIKSDCKLHEQAVLNYKERIEEMETRHEKEIDGVREETKEAIVRLEENNRKDHGKLFDKIDDIKDTLIKLKTA